MIVLTGAAGFIGSNILGALNRRGVTDVVAVDDLTDGSKCANLAGKSFADYVDARDIFSAVAALPKLTAIIHQGACVDTTARDGRAVMQVNYTFSKQLLEVSRSRGCPFVYASSAAVYGSGSRGFREEIACEDARKPYAFSKWAFDQHVRRLEGTAGVPVVGLRYFNVYGPGEDHKARMASVPWHCFQAIRRGESPKLFEGSDRFRRDFIHVADVARVNLFFLDESLAGRDRSGIYNVGTGLPRSFADMGAIISQATGTGPPEVIPFPSDLRGHYQEYTAADIGRLRAAGHRAEFMTLEEGIAAYWNAIV